MQRALLLSAVVFLSWIAGRLSLEPAAPTTVVLPLPVPIHIEPPAPEPLPMAPPVSWQEHGRNRIALNEAPKLLSEWRGIVAAPGGPVLAAWNDEALLWSGDDGATWTRHGLIGNGGAGGTIKLTAAEGGWAHFIVAGHPDALWSFAPDGTRTVRPAPLAAGSTTSFVGGGGRLAMLGTRSASNAREKGANKGEKELALKVSADHGATWQELPAPETGNAGNELSIESDGTLTQMRGQEAACGGGYQHRDRLAPGAMEWIPATWPLDTPLAFWLGAGGFAYGAGDCRAGEVAAGNDGASHLCAIGREDETATAGPLVERGVSMEVVSSGRVTFAIAGRALFLVKGGSFRRVANDVPASIEPGACVDAGGRLIAIAAGRVVRWSATGWEVLLPG